MVRILCEYKTCIHNYEGRLKFGLGRARQCKCPDLVLKSIPGAPFPVCDRCEVKDDKE